MRPPARPLIPDGLLVPESAYLQDGVFTRAQARDERWSDDVQRRLLRTGIWRQLVSGVLVHRDVEVGAWQRARVVALCPGLVVSHATAGRLWGLGTVESLEGTNTWGRRPQGVRFHRLGLHPGDVVEVGGLRVTSPERTVADLLCALPEIESVDVFTRALQQRLLGAADLHAAARRARGRTGAPKARALALSLMYEPHSVLEWRLQRRVGDLGHGWRFNTEIRDKGELVAVVDAVHGPTRVVVELDGKRFHGPERFQADRTRDQRLVALGYVVLHFTWADLEHRLDEVIEIIRRTVALRSPGGRVGP